MKNLRLLLPAVVIAAALAVSCSKKEEPVESSTTLAVSDSAKPGWLTSYEQAQKEALTGNKLLLMDFTGSDWCGWCVALDKEVFSKPEFKEYAKKNLVLLELDFPKRKKMPAGIVKQNQQLAMKYQIMSFPTVVVLNGSGQVVGALGYVPGGPSAWIAELEKLRNG
ncbi:MAG: thioredoxin family protein [Chthoniobacterales bacterium]